MEMNKFRTILTVDILVTTGSPDGDAEWNQRALRHLRYVQSSVGAVRFETPFGQSQFRDALSRLK